MKTHSFSFLIKPLFVLLAFFSCLIANGQLRTYDAGSIIIDMGGGASPTEDNSLRPYGLIYALIGDHGVPVSWVINQSKAKDGVDFIYDGTSFKGGTFVIPSEYVNNDVTTEFEDARWSDVVSVTTTSSFVAYEYALLRSVPKWGVNIEKSDITTGYLGRADIPYGAGTPNDIVKASDLDECIDAFMMSHSDPSNDGHAGLYRYMQPVSEGGFGGWLWAGCHGVSVLENLNPEMPTKYAAYVASGTSGWDNPSAIGSYVDRAGSSRNSGTNAINLEFDNQLSAGELIYFYAKNSSSSDQTISVKSGTGVINGSTVWGSSSNVTIFGDLNSFAFSSTSADGQSGTLITYTIPAGGADGIQIVSNSDDISIDAVGYAAVVTPFTFLSENMQHYQGSGSGIGPGSYSAHSDASLPLTARFPQHPFMQYMGVMDEAFNQGSEEIYYPDSRWRATTSMAITENNDADPHDDPATMVYGRAYGDSDWGYVMYQGGDEAKFASNIFADVAFVRGYLNFSFLAAFEKQTVPNVINVPEVVASNSNGTGDFSVTVTGGESFVWSCDCAGSITPSLSGSTSTAIFDPSFDVSVGDPPVECMMSLKYSDACGRDFNYKFPFEVYNSTSAPAKAVDDIVTFSYGQIYTVDFLDNDFHPNLKGLDYTIKTLTGVNGSFTYVDNGDGTVTFETTSTPTSGSPLQATLTYDLCTEGETNSPANPTHCSSATITVNIEDNTCGAGAFAKAKIFEDQYVASVQSETDMNQDGRIVGASNNSYTNPTSGNAEMTVLLDLTATSPSSTKVDAGTVLDFYVQTAAPGVLNGESVVSTTGTWTDPGGIIIPGGGGGNEAKAKSTGCSIVVKMESVISAGSSFTILAKSPDENGTHSFDVSSSLSSNSGYSSSVTFSTTDKKTDKTFVYTVPAGGMEYIKIDNISYNTKEWKFKTLEAPASATNSFDIKVSGNASVPADWSLISATTVNLTGDGLLQTYNYTVPAGGAKWVNLSNMTNDSDFGFDAIGFDLDGFECADAEPVAESATIYTALGSDVDIDLADYISHELSGAQIDFSSLTISYDPEFGTLDTTSSGLYQASDYTVNYDPDPGHIGSDVFVYRICDNDASDPECKQGVITVITLAPPVAIHDVNYVDAGGTASGNVLTNDFDFNGFNIELSSVGDGSGLPTSMAGSAQTVSTSKGGSVTIQTDGSYVYTPKTGVTSGNDSFEYTICNEEGICESATVVITINDLKPSANKPFATDDNTFTYKNESVSINVVGNDFDLDGNLNTAAPYTTLIGSAVNGVATNNGDGTISFAPTSGFVGDASFVYYICDNSGSPLCDTAEVNIQVIEERPALTLVKPNAIDDYFSTSEPTVVSGNILSNDFDPDGGSMSVSSLNGTSVSTNTVIATANGSVTVSSDGAFAFTPTAGFNGTEVLVYTNCDAESNCSDATIYIQSRTDNVFNSVSAISVCLSDVPYLRITAKANFDIGGLTAVTLWEGGTPNASLTGVSPKDTAYRTVTMGASSFSAGEYTAMVDVLWPGAAESAGVATNWPGWVFTGGAWVAQEDGYSGYRSSDTKVFLTINPTSEVNTGGSIDYPPSSPTCITNPSQDMSGTVWADEDGSGLLDEDAIKNGSEVDVYDELSGAIALYVYAIGSDPLFNGGASSVLGKATVDNTDGTYAFASVVCDDLTLVLTTDDSKTVGDLSSGLGSVGVSGWGGVVVSRTGVDNTGVAGLTGEDFGLHELPTAVTASQAEVFNPGALDVIDVDESAFGGSDPGASTTGGIVQVRLTSFPTNATSVTVDGVSYTSGTWPGGGVTMAADGNGDPTVDIEVDPSGVDDDVVFSYVSIDKAGGESSVAAMTVPVKAIKWIGDRWVNGSSSSIAGHPDNTDGDKAAFILNEMAGANNAHTTAYLEESATLLNLIFMNDVNGKPHNLDVNAAVSDGSVGTGACLKVLGTVEKLTGTADDYGRVRLLAKTDDQYGQYFGPAMENTLMEMMLESGWHTMGFPVSGKSPRDLDILNENADNLFLEFDGNSARNLLYYDSEHSGGEEHGFELHSLTLGKLYASHAYGTWENAHSLDDKLEERGYNLFLDPNFVEFDADGFFKMQVLGTTNDGSQTYVTHNNWGGWNLIPNIYPVAIDAVTMYNDGFFNNGSSTSDPQMFDYAIYIWNPDTNHLQPNQGSGIFSTGSYKAYDAENNQVVAAAADLGNVGALIAPMQSFYIRRKFASKKQRVDAGVTAVPAGFGSGVTAGLALDAEVTLLGGVIGDYTVTMKPEYRADCEVIEHYKTQSFVDMLMLSVVDVQDEKLNDATELAFSSHYTNEIDLGLDINKMSSGGAGAPTLFTIVGKDALVINKMGYPKKDTRVDVGFYAEEHGKEYEIEGMEMPSGWTVYLEDKLTGDFHDLTAAPYVFKNDLNYKVDRFVLHFNMLGAPIDGGLENIEVWNSELGFNVGFNNIVSSKADVLVTNMMGQVMYEAKGINTNETYEIVMNEAAPQAYVVTVVTNGHTESFKLMR